MDLESLHTKTASLRRYALASKHLQTRCFCNRNFKHGLCLSTDISAQGSEYLNIRFICIYIYIYIYTDTYYVCIATHLYIYYSRGCAHGGAAQVEAWSKVTHPPSAYPPLALSALVGPPCSTHSPLRRAPLMLMMRALRWRKPL